MKKNTIFLLLICVFIITIYSMIDNGYFSKNIEKLEINNIDIKSMANNKVSRDFVVKNIGNPIYSDIDIKLFDVYKYKIGNKTYHLKIQYQKSEDGIMFVSEAEMYKHNPKFSIFDFVLWH